MVNKKMRVHQAIAEVSKKILYGVVLLAGAVLIIVALTVTVLVRNRINLSFEIDLLPQNQPNTIWATKEKDVLIIVPENADDLEAYVYWNDAYWPAIIGGVTSGRQFDLIVKDQYLIAGEFHVHSDCLTVFPENDRPQVSDTKFLAGRDKLEILRYDFLSGISQVPYEIMEKFDPKN